MRRLAHLHRYTPTHVSDDVDQRLPRAPFGVLVLLAFLSVDGIERAVELGAWLWSRHASAAPARAYAVNLPVFGLWAIVDALLVLLLVMRTRAGRWFCVVIFLLHAGYMTHVLAGTNPELWIYLGTLGRLRIAVTAAIDLFAACYLLSPAPAEYLVTS